MEPDRIVVRPLQTEEEVDRLFRVNAAAFRGDDFTEDDIARWRQEVETAPGFDRSQLRAAFIGGRQVGSYGLHQRQLCIGRARLLTGCIGGVATHPDYQRRGIARAMMDDSLHLARQQRLAILMLDGIPGFYHRWGYIDALDVGECHLRVKDVPPQPLGLPAVREAVPDDAPPLLDLYHRHHDHYAGKLERTLDEQHYVMRCIDPQTPIQVAVDQRGQLCGYAILSRTDRTRAVEVVADDWPATLALLHTQVAQLGGDVDPETVLRWEVPLASETYRHLADQLPVDYHIHQQPDADWMVSSIDLSAILAAMVPEWRAQWTSQRADWRGTLRLRIQNAAITFELGADELRVVEASARPSSEATLSPRALTQLIFGFRPIEHFINQAGNEISDETLPALRTLFPARHGWIAATDRF